MRHVLSLPEHRGVQLLARLHVRQALGRQRVAAQIRKGPAVVQASRLLQLGKHAGKTSRIVTGLDQNAVAHTIGFPLHVPGVAQLGLDRGSLTAHNQRLCTLGTFTGCQCPQNHGADQPRRHFGLIAHAPGNVPLSDMAELVRQHRSQLIRRADHGNQAQMYAQITTR